MMDIYCDSSFNGEADFSFIGCVILADGVEVHQSTTRILPDPRSSLECEMAAIDYAMRLARVFRRGNEPVVIYNDNTEAVKAWLEQEAGFFPVEFSHRENPYQSLADRLSKRFPQKLAEAHDLCRKPVEALTPAVLEDIGVRHRPVVYLSRDEEQTTNTKTVYRLTIRSFDGALSDDRLFEARSGEVKNVKVAKDVSAEIESLNIDLTGAYFLLTDETWGLRLRGGEAYSILPCSIPHHVICHEVDRSPANLWRRVAAMIGGENK